MDRRYARNSGAVYVLGYHLVWCPKYRKGVLLGQVETRLKELIAERGEEHLRSED
jgi:putative transposase